MYNQKIELRKTRNFGEKINATFDFIRHNYKGLFPCILFISAPVALIGSLLITYYQVFIQFQHLGDYTYEAPSIVLYFLPGYLLIIAGYILNGAVITNYMGLYTETPDPKSITVSEVWFRAKYDFWMILIGGFLVGIMVSIGFVFLFIPALYLFVVFSLFIPSMVFEQKSIGEAIGRCFFLIRDKWWSTFGLAFILTLLQIVMGLVFNIPQYVFLFLTTYHASADSLTTIPTWYKIGMIVSAAISSIGALLVGCLTFVGLSFQYFNLVERREASGLLSKLEGLGKKAEDTQDADDNVQESY